MVTKFQTTLITIVVGVLLVCGATFAYRYFMAQEVETPIIQTVEQSKDVSSSADDTASSADDTASSADDTASSADDTSFMPNLSLLDTDGKNTTYAQVADGKPAILNLWATWCPYCVDELDDYQSLYETYGSQISFLLVDLPDGSYETIDGAKDYVGEHSYTFPVYFDTAGESLTAFGTSGIPVTAIANADGEMVYYTVGRMNTDEVEAVLAELANG